MKPKKILMTEGGPKARSLALGSFFCGTAIGLWQVTLAPQVDEETSMFGHWFVIASKVNTRIFTHIPGERTPKLIKIFNNPLGLEKNRTLIRKEAGMGLRSRGRTGIARYMEVGKHNPREDAALQFARQIVTFLDLARKDENFKSLTIAAEPHFLGKLKSSMKPQLRKIVVEWVEKDLQKVPARNLANSIDLNQVPMSSL